MTKFMTVDEMIAVEGTAPEVNVGYIPMPNVVDVVLSDKLAPADLTPTAFAFSFFENGDVLMAHNRRREVEVPGGHRDPLPSGNLEHPADTAKREAEEEIGAKVDYMIPIGFMRSSSDGNEPENYRYPFPEACQQFFAARIVSTMEFDETDECRPPVRMTHEDMLKTFKPRTLALYEAARAAMLPHLSACAKTSHTP